MDDGLRVGRRLEYCSLFLKLQGQFFEICYQSVMSNCDSSSCVVCSYGEHIVQLGARKRSISNMTYSTGNIFLSQRLLFNGVMKKSHSFGSSYAAAVAPGYTRTFLSSVLECVQTKIYFLQHRFARFAESSEYSAHILS